MSINWKRNLGHSDWKALGIIVVVAVVLVSLLMNDGGRRDRQDDATPTVSATVTSKAPAKKPTPTGDATLTSSAGRYSCAGGASFTLTTYANGTARVTGGAQAATSAKVLTKTSIGIWRSDDLSVQIREIAGYTILLENNVTTRDSCVLKK